MILIDPTAAVVPCSESLRRAIGLDLSLPPRPFVTSVIPPLVQAAAVNGTIRYGLVETRQHEAVTGYSCLLELTNTRTRFSLVLVQRHDVLEHIAVNPVVDEPSVDRFRLRESMQWSILSSIARKAVLYGFQFTAGFNGKSGTFEVKISTWNRWTSDEKAEAVANLKLLLDDYLVVSRDFSPGATIKIFGIDSAKERGNYSQKTIQQLRDEKVGRPLLFNG